MKTMLSVMILLGLASTMALAGGEKGSWTGQVGDAKCAPKVSAQCTKKCIESGEPVVFVTDKDGTVMQVANQEALKDHVGHHVRIDGTVADNRVTIEKVTMVGD